MIPQTDNKAKTFRPIYPYVLQYKLSSLALPAKGLSLGYLSRTSLLPGPQYEPWRGANGIKEVANMSRQSDSDNRSQQLNPNNDAYWQSRGFDERPDDWEERTRTKGENSEQQADAKETK